MKNRCPGSLLLDRPHRRLNALTGEWVFVSPQRTQRPWQGRKEHHSSQIAAPYDPNCYLCPGNARANNARNPDYHSTYVFPNDYPAFLPDCDSVEVSRSTLLSAHIQSGVSRVVCYSPRHDLTLADLSVTEVRALIDTWAAQISELSDHWRWVQVFENKGEIMGCSNPHPHGQIWAGDFIPTEPARELAQQQTWQAAHGTPLLLNYSELELEARERLVTANEHWVALVPWWAIWPFETLLLPRRHVRRLPELTDLERDALANLLSRLLKTYDRLFDIPFPYSFGWHGAPSNSGEQHAAHQGSQLHGHFYPPLLRSASVRKFMVGYEMLAEPQRDISPEWAAELLRSHVQEQ